MKLRTWCIRTRQKLTQTGPLLKKAWLLLLVCCLFSFSAFAEQGITIRQQNAPLEKIFQAIEKQTGYRFFYNESLLNGTSKVSIDLRNGSLQDALEICFKGQPLTYSIVEKTIVVKKKAEVVVARTVTSNAPKKIIAVRGKVTSGKTPVENATVAVKGTNNMTATDAAGVFTLGDVDVQGVLVISHISHQTREVGVEGKSFIAIDLNSKINDLDEAIVVAYNTTTHKRNTGSVTVIKGEQIATLPNRSIDRSLQGMVPGLLVTSGNGQPGGGVSNFVLRGISTGTDAFLGSTVRNPLFVVDGIPVSQDLFQIPSSSAIATPVSNPLAQLNPSDIESITVLKDAAAIALYGSKASNGVILITTQKGKSGKTSFNVKHQTDIARRAKTKLEFLTQEEYLDLLFESYRNSDSTLTDADIKKDLQSLFPTRPDGSFYPAPNWSDELYDDHAVTTSNEISMTGGSEKSTHYISLEYTDQKGVLKNTGYKRASTRFNFESNVNKWLKLGVNTAFSYNKQDYSSNSAEGAISYGLADLLSPLNPVRDAEGKFILNYEYGIANAASYAAANPLAEAEYNFNRIVSYRGLSKFYVEVNAFRYFNLSSAVGFDFMQSENREKIDPRFYLGSNLPGTGQIQNYDTRRGNLISTNILRFSRTFDKVHALNLLAGEEAQILNQRSVRIVGQGYRSPSYDDVNLAATPPTVSATNYKETLLSFFTQANYSYANKYLLTGSLRRDGSSKFGKNRRYGTYWSAGLGWILSEEAFMQSTGAVIKYLKIRGSVGAAGNSAAINRNTQYDVLGGSYYLGDYAVLPFTSVPSNPDIRWEKTLNMDVGLELRLGNRVQIYGDVYKRKTSDLIYLIKLAPTTGYLNVLDNIGSMENKGVELSISADILKTKDFRWNINANWSTNKNVLVKANVPLAVSSFGNLVNKEGENFNSFYLRRWAGVNPVDGAPMWMDSTGKLSDNYYAAKEEIVGKPQPDGFGGITNVFSYKNMEFSFFINYKYGYQGYDYSASFSLNDGTYYPYVNQLKTAFDRWQNPGDIASNPKRTLNNPANGSQASTRYLFDADHIRLESASFSYTFSDKLVHRLHLSNLKLYAQAYNIALLWTKVKGQDPDLMNVAGSVTSPYPRQRSFGGGINVKF